MKNNLAASEVHTRCELKVGHGWFYSPLPIDIQSTDIMLVLPEYPRRAHMHHALSDERLEGDKSRVSLSYDETAAAACRIGFDRPRC